MQFVKNVLVYVFGVFAFSVFVTVFMRVLSLNVLFNCVINLCDCVKTTFSKTPTARTLNRRIGKFASQDSYTECQMLEA